MKCISLSLFGYNKQKHKDCFDFPSYIRGLLMHVRMSRLLFPDWRIVLNTDKETYHAFKDLFERLPITLCINNEAPLTKAMLWRMKPVFNRDYTHVICRDLDAPPTYREAQCVQEWINSDKAAHAITDSISHGVPMLGGMIGFRPIYFTMHTPYTEWDQFFEDIDIDFSRKGADQDFLNKCIYPSFANHETESILQHYILGMPNTFLQGYRNRVPDIEVENVPRELEETNECCSHMGQAGWLLPQTFRIFRKYQDRFTDLLEIEKRFPDIAYWVKDGTFE